jgi:hypothetical protein
VTRTIDRCHAINSVRSNTAQGGQQGPIPICQFAHSLHLRQMSQALARVRVPKIDSSPGCTQLWPCLLSRCGHRRLNPRTLAQKIPLFPSSSGPGDWRWGAGRLAEWQNRETVAPGPHAPSKWRLRSPLLINQPLGRPLRFHPVSLQQMLPSTPGGGPHGREILREGCGSCTGASSMSEQLKGNETKPSATLSRLPQTGLGAANHCTPRKCGNEHGSE